MKVQRYEVTAQGEDGREYVYRVDADSRTQAACRAYQVHGEWVRAGELSARLTPWHTVELIASL